ncbi:unnamed protein product, partial [Rotaria sp. Silwood2]
MAIKKNNISTVQKLVTPGAFIINKKCYQVVMTQTLEKKNDQNFLDPIFRDILQPLIDKLTSKELLRRCLRGITQNSNESLNSIVWSILSKSKHHGYRSVRGCAALAAMYFNSGSKILIKYFSQCG